MATDIPKARQELTKVRRELHQLEHTLRMIGETGLADKAHYAAADIALIIDEYMIRRVNHANGRTVNRRITPLIVRGVLDFYRSRPGITYQEVGQQFGINAGRVSEIVNGLRTEENPHMKGDGLNKVIAKGRTS